MMVYIRIYCAHSRSIGLHRGLGEARLFIIVYDVIVYGVV